MSDKTDLQPVSGALWRIIVRLLLIVAAALAIHALMGWVMMLAEGRSSALMGGLLVLSLLAYAILIAVPFVPGIEIGVSLMMLSGPKVALPVYVATLLGLTLAFAAGRFLPYDWLHRFFLDLRLTRACKLLTDLKPLSRERRLALLRRQMPERLGALMVNYRYVAIAILLNLPGNALIGGGGGISLIAGLSRLFTFRAFLLTLAIAVAPVPFAVWFFGIDILH